MGNNKNNYQTSNFLDRCFDDVYDDSSQNRQNIDGYFNLILIIYGRRVSSSKFQFSEIFIRIDKRILLKVSVSNISGQLPQ